MAQSNKTRLINQILRNQLQQGGVKPTVPSRLQQNQFTLPDGRTIELPTFPENLPTTTSRGGDYYTCENDWCCLWDGSTDSQSDLPVHNYAYHQADWGVAYGVLSPLVNWVISLGTIYIEGIPSTNPLSCIGKFNEQNGSHNVESCEETCTGFDTSNCDSLTEYDNERFDCTGDFWARNLGSSQDPNYFEDAHVFCGDGWNYNSNTGELDILSNDCANPNQKVCTWKRWLFPNLNMNDWNEPTGTGDAIAAIYNGKVVGFNYINNIFISSGESLPGIVIPMQHQHGHVGDNLSCYPEIGETIDDLLLYKADTGNYYKLTDESHQILMDNIQPFGDIPGAMTAFVSDLYFELWDGSHNEAPCLDCKTICPDWYNDEACNQECEFLGKSRGCRYNYEGTDNPNNGCFCNNPELGCCDEGSFLPETEEPDMSGNYCRKNRDCREGSVCKKGRCVLIPVQQQQLPEQLPECRCTKVNNCDEIFGEQMCNICSDLESDILNHPNYTYSDGQAYCEYEFPAICDDDGNCGNNLCDFSCGNDRF